jgi:hypothetical protein
MTTPVPLAGDPPQSRRLNGWKEIAAYFGKGVRTVQRWEVELNLPVRRAPGTEIVYAFTAELDAWHRGAGAAAGGDAPEPAPEPDGAAPAPATSPPAAARRALWLYLVGLAAVGGVVVAWLIWVARPEHSQPYSFKIENYALRIFAEDGRFLWERRFSPPLRSGYYTPDAIRVTQPAAIVDLDGDGAREVLFQTALEPPTDEGLFCFDHDGALRFHHRGTHQVHFGSASYGGPWKPTVMKVIADERGRKSIWLASHHQDEFPTVVEKLDARGRVLGRYWNDGTVSVLEPFVLAGRPVVLVGGANNETLGATLVAVDAARPDGRAPATAPKYTCGDCPTGAPVEFFAFPPTDIQRALNVPSAVDEVRIGGDGTVTVVVANYITAAVPNGSVQRGEARYVFDGRLKPLRAEIEASFRLVHDALHRLALLDHPADARDERALWPVLRWESGAFKEVAPAGAR